MTKIKVCGLTSLGDARLALEYGVDFIGFIVDVPVPTPRKITALEVVEIVSQTAREQAIFVLMDPKLQQLEPLLALHPFALQLHGNEKPELIQEIKNQYPVKIIKTLHVKTDSTFDEIKVEAESYNLADYLLFDTQTDKIGGTGVVHDWKLTKKLASELGKPVFLSGGLNSLNVCEAIKMVEPFAVDVSSGVESEPGVKDPARVKKFIKEVKECSI